MNIYEKMQAMRCAMQNTKLKKSGKNKFAGYEYFELQDIIPTINKLMAENKVSTELSFGDYNEQAVLKFINAEKPDETMQFTCPVKPASLKGCHEIQNLGAVITYTRRYLYVNAFEIVEHDALDSMPMDSKAPAKPQQAKVVYISDALRQTLGKAVAESGYTPGKITEYLLTVHGIANSKMITPMKLKPIMQDITEKLVQDQIDVTGVVL